MTPYGFRALALPSLLALAAPASAQCEAETQAIHTLIDQYAQHEAASDMAAQARLMSDDRVHVTQVGRMTNQAMNMDVQQADLDAQRQMVPGARTFVDARDRMVRFYGGGCDVAVASFYWYVMPVLPGNLPPATMQLLAEWEPPEPSAVSLVLEEGGGGWRIVHTHASPLGGD